MRPSLETMARRGLLPTPTATLGSNGGRVTLEKQRRGGAPTLAAVVDGILNPDWVDGLMHLEIGWTDCDWPATVSSPIKPNSPYGSSYIA